MAQLDFDNERAFEDALVTFLNKEAGWSSRVEGVDDILVNPTEEALLDNWAKILFANNKEKDRLNGVPLSKTEMERLLNKVRECRSPLKAHGFINGESISVLRDANSPDEAHRNMDVSLRIFNRDEIAAGSTYYQIARQPRFKMNAETQKSRRGDVMLLINGLPLFHIELKKSGIPVEQAFNQINKYISEHVFTGFFGLVQIFVAMTPRESRYFANPGPGETCERRNLFRWADFNNEPVMEWYTFAKDLLAIPPAHQMIGYYTVADEADGVLKVMRSYQVYAVQQILNSLREIQKGDPNQRGGYIWHTTGSGKTLTSFKAAQLIAQHKVVDKVVFLTDRIELGTQSFKNYKNFAGGSAQEVFETEDTRALKSRLDSSYKDGGLIVTSIQKMHTLCEEGSSLLLPSERKKFEGLRVVFIVDECHRSTFGSMMQSIKATFLKATFFGFTGTPILEDHKKVGSTTAMIFGNELHRYSLTDGIRDGNVLGFDPTMVSVWDDMKLREKVALRIVRANSVEEALADPEREAKYREVCTEWPMILVETELTKAQYQTDSYRKTVVGDILRNFDLLTSRKLFHTIFATSSIKEAIQYYRIFKEFAPELKVSALFEPGIDNNDNEVIDKVEALQEIVADYNKLFGTTFSVATFPQMKKDIASRLAHKDRIGIKPAEQINLLIVVNQMLTGFDSKWVNTLFLDKELANEGLIQAFSRTNRVYGKAKPAGIIRYYRKPYTMRQNIENAVKLYSGDQPQGLFVDRLAVNLHKMIDAYNQILHCNMPEDFSRLPEDEEDQRAFAESFAELVQRMRIAQQQGYTLDQQDYNCNRDQMLADEKIPDELVDRLAAEDPGNFNIKESVGYLLDDVWEEATDSQKTVMNETIHVPFTREQFEAMRQRYNEIPQQRANRSTDLPFDIDPYLSSTQDISINAEYMQMRFTKFLRALQSGDAVDEVEKEFHTTFARLPREEQNLAEQICADLKSGALVVEEGKTFRDYIEIYRVGHRNDKIHQYAQMFGMSEEKLRAMKNQVLDTTTLNLNDQFNDLIATIDWDCAFETWKAQGNQEELPGLMRAKILLAIKGFLLDKHV